LISHLEESSTLCVEDMSYCLVSREYERWIQGHMPSLSTTAAAFSFSTSSFSCGGASSGRVAVGSYSGFLILSAAYRYWICTHSKLFSKYLGSLTAKP
jgi:hypothetical protein